MQCDDKYFIVMLNCQQVSSCKRIDVTASAASNVFFLILLFGRSLLCNDYECCDIHTCRMKKKTIEV